jgi:hypothetical protein
MVLVVAMLSVSSLFVTVDVLSLAILVSLQLDAHNDALDPMRCVGSS